MTDLRPALSCPECGAEGLIPAQGRGYHTRDGNETIHADTCRCRWCDWWWWDDPDPVECVCGAKVIVGIDDDIAFARVLVDPARVHVEER